MGGFISPLSNSSVDIDTGLECFLLLARFYGVPTDGAQLKHEFLESGKKFAEQEVLLAAKYLGFKASAVDTASSRLTATPLPAIAIQNDGTFIVLATEVPTLRTAASPTHLGPTLRT